MALRYQVDPANPEGGTLSDPSKPNVTEKPVEAPAEPTVRLGNVRTRWTAEEGMTVLNDGRDHSKDYNSANRSGVDPLDNARSQAGLPLLRHELTLDSIVESKAWGGSMRLREALSAGFVRKTADGFVLTDEAMTKPPADEKSAEDGKPKAEGDDAPIDAKDVPPTSVETDVFVKAIETQVGKSVHSGLVSAMTRGADTAPYVEAIASKLGMTPADVQQGVEARRSELERAAKVVLQKAGVRPGALNDLLAHSYETDRDGTAQAIEDFAMRQDVNGLTKLARRYARTGRQEYAGFSNAEILGAEFGSGISAREVDGKVMLNVPGHGELSFEKAVRIGAIRFV